MSHAKVYVCVIFTTESSIGTTKVGQTNGEHGNKYSM